MQREVFLAESDERLLVERPRRARIDHLRADAGLLQHLGGAERDRHHAARRDDRDVLAQPLDLGDPEGVV
jgi:hypothetical protein